MDSIETAIVRTVLYGDVFGFPMTPEEIHHFLICDEPVSFARMQHALAGSPLVNRHVEIDRGYVVRIGRRALIDQRLARERASFHLWPLAVTYGTWLARLPFVRMVAVTGALAMRNAADQHDDLDYLLVTTSNRVWLARAFSIVIVRLVGLRGVVICPNYVLAESAMEQSRKDLFIAHEITQMVPIYGHELYHEFRAANQWVRQHLPNAAATFHEAPEYPLGSLWVRFKRLLETLLSAGMGDRLEKWEYRRKLRRFASDMQSPNSDAQLDEHHVKGHFNDYGHPVLRKYHERLRECGLEEIPLAAPGD